jgi:hypothetical protein
MRSTFIALAAVAAIGFTALTPRPQAQVSIEIGAAPNCPYGYYDYTPFSCAPYGYYGPEWFNGGVFIGAGKWFHGPSGFHGKVDNRYDPQHGYTGASPKQGEAADPKRGVAPAKFKGNEARDGQGHTVPNKR